MNKVLTVFMGLLLISSVSALYGIDVNTGVNVNTSSNNNQMHALLNIDSDLDINLNNNSNLAYVELSNGEQVEVKTTPEEAMNKASAELGTQCNDCTVKMVEVESNNEYKAAYRVEDRYRAKFLALFPFNAKVYAHVDAQTGQVIDTRKSFMAALSTRLDDY